MNCTIPGQNLKVMGRAIHALAKIGDELYMQASNNELTFRTVNMAKTSFSVYKFLLPFFTSYTIKIEESSQTDIKCKIPMKAILGVFKSPQQMEKQVELCRIELQSNSTKICFKFRYKHDINKTQTIWLLNDECLQIAFTNPVVPNILTAPASFYAQALQNFQTSDDEISLEIVSQNKIILRNYVEGERNKLSHMRSQLSLNGVEFDMFKIGLNTTITFALKPFRAAIQFAEYFNLCLTLSFESPGKPVVLIISNVLFEANFILATMHGCNETQTNTIISSTVLKNDEDVNLSQEDKNALKSINWDKDFEMEEKGKEEEEEEEEMALVIIPDSPESPRSKRMKTVFKRCFENTYHASQRDEIILAENSDDET